MIFAYGHNERCLSIPKGYETFPPRCSLGRDHDGPHKVAGEHGYRPAYYLVWEEGDYAYRLDTE